MNAPPETSPTPEERPALASALALHRWTDSWAGCKRRPKASELAEARCGSESGASWPEERLSRFGDGWALYGNSAQRPRGRRGQRPTEGRPPAAARGSSRAAAPAMARRNASLAPTPFSIQALLTKKEVGAVRVVAAARPCPQMLLPGPEGTSACCWRLFDPEATTLAPVLQPPQLPTPQEQQRFDPAAARSPLWDSDSVLSEEHDGDREDDEQEPGSREGHVPADSRRPRERLHCQGRAQFHAGGISTEQGHTRQSPESWPTGRGSGPPTTGEPGPFGAIKGGLWSGTMPVGDKAR